MRNIVLAAYSLLRMEFEMTLDEMAAEIAWLAQEFDEKFLPLAKALREFRDALLGQGKTDPFGLFDAVCKNAGIGRRKAFYLIEIDRIYGTLNIPMHRLTAIGWTKLCVMAKHIDPQDLEEWLKLGETHTVAEIRDILAGEDATPNWVTLRFSNANYAVFRSALIANGALLTSGGGLAGKEPAILKIVEFQVKALKSGYL